MTQYAKITGLGIYLPSRVLTNHELEHTVETSDEWIVKRTGISQRHLISEHDTASSMGEVAAREALLQAGLTVNDIDLIIVATTTPDKVFPSTACLLQARLGVPACAAFDVTAVCSGFVYALTIADKFIKTGAAKHALVVGSECISRLIDWTDRSTCVLFGDGAGACVLSAAKEPGILSTTLLADGRYADLLYADNANRVDCVDPYIHMKGKELFRFVVKEVAELIQQEVQKQNLNLQDVDWIIPHQANDRMLEALSQALNYPSERMISTIKEHANTSAASIPLAFYTAVKAAKVQRGDKVMCVGFGGGITWGAVLLIY